MIISFIAAMGTNGVIGRDGKLPWSLPGDLKRFRAITWGKPIIMGRKTYESLGRALAGRTSIILTRQPDFHATGCLVAHSPDEARAIAEGEKAREAVIIGGREIFEAFLPDCERIHLTVVEGEFEGDTYFPLSILESSKWASVHQESCPADERNRFNSRYEVYERRD
ncbi:MAG: dihydrofolate reductase [Isosphaeraceae bacterium]